MTYTPEFRLSDSLDAIGDQLAALDLMFMDRGGQLDLMPRHISGLLGIIDAASDEITEARATLSELSDEVRALRAPTAPAAAPLADELPVQIVTGILRACDEAGQVPEPAWLWMEAQRTHEILLAAHETADDRPIGLVVLLRQLGRALSGGVRPAKAVPPVAAANETISVVEGGPLFGRIVNEIAAEYGAAGVELSNACLGAMATVINDELTANVEAGLSQHMERLRARLAAAGDGPRSGDEVRRKAAAPKLTEEVPPDESGADRGDDAAKRSNG